MTIQLDAEQKQGRKQAAMRDAMQERLRLTRHALMIACDGDREKYAHCMIQAEKEMYPIPTDEPYQEYR